MKTPKISNKSSSKLEKLHSTNFSSSFHLPSLDSNTCEIAKLDSGASNNYQQATKQHVYTNIRPAPTVKIKLPDSTLEESDKWETLPLSKKFSEQARTTRIVPKLSSTNLLSVGTLCDDEAIAIFNLQKVYIIKGNEIILEGFRNNYDNLYDVPLQEPTTTKKVDIKIITKLLAPGIYLNRKQKALLSKQLPSTVPTQSIQTKHTSTVPKYWNNIDTLICDNEDYYHIKQQEKEDSKTIVRNKIFNDFHGLHAIIDDNIKPLADKWKAREEKIEHKPQINVILQKNKTKEDLAIFHHTSICAPVAQTLVLAIKKIFFITFPGLTPDLISKNLPVSEETEMGHMNQERQGLQSTSKNNKQKDATVDHTSTIDEQFPPSDHLVKQPLLNTFVPDPVPSNTFSHSEQMDEDYHPQSDTPNVKTNNALYTLISSKEGEGFMDLTGRFPYRSASGHEYIMVAYNYDANAILATPVKNRDAKTLADAWERLNDKFKECGVNPETYIIDNECSTLLKEAFKKHGCDFQ